MPGGFLCAEASTDQSANRYRDVAVSPDGRTIYIATDTEGLSGAIDAGIAPQLENSGAILAFTYLGEGTPLGNQHLQTNGFLAGGDSLADTPALDKMIIK